MFIKISRIRKGNFPWPEYTYIFLSFSLGGGGTNMDKTFKVTENSNINMHKKNQKKNHYLLHKITIIKTSYGKLQVQVLLL